MKLSSFAALLLAVAAASFAVLLLAVGVTREGNLRRSLEGHEVPLVLPVIRCTSNEPCGECQGDCTTDADCSGDLVCYQKHGKAQTDEEAMVPGCVGLDYSKTDWCVDPNMVPDHTDCSNPGKAKFPNYGVDSPQRMLLREGVIDEISPNLCEKPANMTKNVILVIGDGMGWEMVRAGAIARQVIDELEAAGCDTKTGCPDLADVQGLFSGRTLADYYTEGKGSGLSFQKLEGYQLVTTSAPVLQGATPGNHYAPASTLLEGLASDHNDRQAELYVDQCGFPYEFNPLNVEEGGNMALWNNVKGGEFPWDEHYYQENPDTSSGFDPTFIMQHATDSANTAGSYATGAKGAVGQLSQDLYEQDVQTIIEDALMCGKAGGVVTTVPVFHATPGAFILHSNNRSNRDQLRTSWKTVNPTFVSGTCAGSYDPYPEDLQSMRDGDLSLAWTLLEQNNQTLAENFYDNIAMLDPDFGDHVMVCLSGEERSKSGQDNMPFRGVDSTYSNRWCSSGEEIIDEESGATVGINLTTPEELCDHYPQEELPYIPKIQDNVKAALEFLGKDDDGFFLMYEQGDIDWAAHANHMDDMLGAMLDIDDSVKVIIDWIEANGGYEKNVLYVTADHDHYLTLQDHFPEALATFIIAGESHKITPFNNSNVNTWEAAINAGAADDNSQSQTDHLQDFSTWSEEELAQVAHFWGPRGSGGNGWGSHSSRPVPISYAGDDGCLEQFLGKEFLVVGKEVAGSPGKIDQVHVNACMYKHLFGL